MIQLSFEIMGKVKIEYLAIMHGGDSIEKPSQIVRRERGKNPTVYKTEGCNRAMKWRESNDYIKYFIGMSDEGYSMTEEEAERVLVKWRERWENPKFDKRML